MDIIDLRSYRLKKQHNKTSEDSKRQESLIYHDLLVHNLKASRDIINIYQARGFEMLITLYSNHYIRVLNKAQKMYPDIFTDELITNILSEAIKRQGRD